MKVSKIIIDKILTDKKFSSDLGQIFNIKQISVELLARRSSGKLTQYAAVQYYRSCGFTDEEIFETENVKEVN